MFNKKLKARIEELERRINIMMPKECKSNNHKMEWVQYCYMDDFGNGTSTAIYECKKCGIRP
jgi:hypothetical protein